MIPSDCHPAVPPLLWTLDQSRFSFPRGFYSLLLSDDTFNDFIAPATGEFLSINNNNSVYGNLSKLIYVCRSFLFQFTRTEPKIQAAKRDEKAGREKETWGKTSSKGPWVRLQTTLLPSSQEAWGHWTGKHWIKKCSFPAKQRFLLLHPGDNTVYPYSSGSHLTPQTPCGSKTWCHFSN